MLSMLAIFRNPASRISPSSKKAFMETRTTTGVNTAEKDSSSPIARLFQLGREKSFITYDDILRYLPHPEEDLDQLDRVFACFLCAGIPFGVDAEHLCHPITDRIDMDDWY